MHNLSAELKQWLDYPVSITDRLKKRAPHTHLECLSHRWSKPLDIWDYRILNENASYLRREIIMWASQHACWYARTLIPKITYDTYNSLFMQLKTKSLGELIWNNPAVQRIAMQQFCIHPFQAEYDIIKKIDGSYQEVLWGRLSTFTLNKNNYPNQHLKFEMSHDYARNKCHFYLLEIFLPDLKHYYE